MNQIAAIAPYRWPDTIYADILAQRSIVDAYCSLAASYMAIDLRPIVIYPDSRVEHVGPDPVPESVRVHIDDARAKLYQLEIEYRDSVRRNSP